MLWPRAKGQVRQEHTPQSSFQSSRFACGAQCSTSMYALSRALRTVPLTVVAFAHTQCESACPEEASYGKWQENWDGRSPLPGAKHKPGPTKHILLIRHGQYDRNDQHRQLTALGIEQARLTGAKPFPNLSTHQLLSCQASDWPPCAIKIWQTSCRQNQTGSLKHRSRSPASTAGELPQPA